MMKVCADLNKDELAIINAWIDLNVPFIGEYDEMHDWNEADIEYYNKKMDIRAKMEAIEASNIKQLIENN